MATPIQFVLVLEPRICCARTRKFQHFPEYSVKKLFRNDDHLAMFNI